MYVYVDGIVAFYGQKLESDSCNYGNCRALGGFLPSGLRGLGEGFLKGVRGAVAQPVSGLMHGAQHIAPW